MKSEKEIWKRSYWITKWHNGIMAERRNSEKSEIGLFGFYPIFTSGQNNLIKPFYESFISYLFNYFNRYILRIAQWTEFPGSATHIRLLEDKSIDVVLAGESQQWETYEYMRDAVDQGRKKAIILSVVPPTGLIKQQISLPNFNISDT